MARRTRRSGSVSAGSAARRRAGGVRRTGVDEREGWEDFAQKREWFLSGRALDGPERDDGRRHARDPGKLDRGEPGFR